jgi:heat shock protein HslJ
MLLGVALTLLLPLQDAYADRSRHHQKRAPRSAKMAAIVPRTPAAALTLVGTYALTSVNGRPVRNAELAKSVVTFSANGDVLVQTACNRFGTLLQTRTTPNQILGFGQTVHTTLPCTPAKLEAETGTTRLFRDTANIARAGSSVTFFNANGVTIAQWTATVPPSGAVGQGQTVSSPAAVPAPTGERATPPRGALPPPRAYFGDYVLSALNGSPIGVAVPVSSEAAPTRRSAISQLSPSQPTLFLRENGTVTGSSGCNQYTTTWVRAGDSMSRFGPVITTKKACLNRATRTLEAAFFGALRSASRVEVSADKIDIFGANDRLAAQLSAIGARQAGPNLYGKKWILRRLNGVALGTTNPPTITFTGNEASGTTGCNNYTIDHQRQNGRSRFRGGIMTEMACVAAPGNGLEGRYMSALRSISTLQITTTSLTMRSSDGRNVMVFAAE